MSVMTLNNFNNILPKDGEYVTPNSANRGPIQNRLDLIYFNIIIDNIQKLFNDHDLTFSPKDAFIILNSDVNSIVKYLNELKVNLGNKFRVNLNNTLSITNEINEIDFKVYTSDKLTSILSRYEKNTRGNYIKTGCEVSIEKVISTVNSVQCKLSKINNLGVNYADYLIDYIIKNGKALDTNTLIELFYNYTNIKTTLLDRSTPILLNNKKSINLIINAGNIMINGHIFDIPKKTLILPYSNDIDVNYPQRRVDTLAYTYYDATDEEMLLKYDSNITYNKVDIVYYNNSLYLSKIDSNTNTITDTNYWFKIKDTLNTEMQRVLLLYHIGECIKNSTVQGITYYNSFPINIKSNECMPISYIYNNDLTPSKAEYEKYNIVINNISDIRSSTVKDINKIVKNETSLDYNVNLLEVQALTKLKNGINTLNGLTRNTFIDAFENDVNRDIELEKIESGSPCITTNGVLEIGSTWDIYPLGIQDEILLDTASESSIITQDKFSRSRLINPNTVYTFSSLPFKIRDNVKTFIAEYITHTDTKNFTKNIKFNWWESAPSDRFTSNKVNKGYSFENLPENGRYIKKDNTSINITLGKYSFNSNEKITLKISDVYSTEIQSDINGAVNTTITVPGNILKNMKYTVILTGNTSQVKAISGIEVQAIKRIHNITINKTRIHYDRSWWLTWSCDDCH